jgi:hypothetical protein
VGLKRLSHQYGLGYGSLAAGADESSCHLPGAVLPGALLRRLRELKKRGRQFQDVKFMDWAVTQLARAVADLYWI